MNLQSKTPDEVMRAVTEDIICRAIKLSRKKGRTVYISKTAKGNAVDIRRLDPATPDGAQALQAYLTPIKRHYTISGLGAPEDKDAINWRVVNMPFWRRMLVLFQVGVSFVMKGTPLKNKLYRWMGAHIGKNVEIMQMTWVDHFRPELIFVGDNTLIGAFSRLTVHAYEGSGKFRYGVIEIGSNCMIGAGTGIGPITIENGVRTLPGTTLSPYLFHIKAGAVVGYAPPPVRFPDGAAVKSDQVVRLENE